MDERENRDEDLLSWFIGNSDNSAEFLRDIFISFILAGPDTTSAALTWFFWLLSSRPDVLQRIHQELKTMRASNGKNVDDTFSFDELREMHYLNASISEALRLMEAIWGNDCREFRPERWLKNGMVKQESPFWFSVFHAGLRMCLGNHMAYTQMKSIAAAVIERFEIEVQA
ncbi:hypothetical protein RJ639_041386 [Escallonia herrerae]|uniref:Cytochrome P450 n=1 Tax=Escallonia herrerae TaxID=1293975 RepID=A0AA88WES3_9ASTE|nr:hypothetical protein RJ639_041386 [Escallonia herrerae]